MDIDDATFLRELRRELLETAPEGQAAQVQRFWEVLARHNATLDDVARVVGAVRLRRQREIRGLADRIAQIADQRSDDAATADAVDAFVRSLAPDRGTNG